jgi:TorA maturation chaperone TorD
MRPSCLLIGGPRRWRQRQRAAAGAAGVQRDKAMLLLLADKWQPLFVGEKRRQQSWSSWEQNE